MRPGVRDWFNRSTSAAADWPLDKVLAAKAGRTVDVILPALNEQDTVGNIASAIRGALMCPGRTLVDDLVVIDSGSADATARVAADAGARVLQRDQVLGDIPVERGKGEAMWRALAATAGDVVVFIDADLNSFTPEYVVGLLGPLLMDDTVHLVKSVYDRPLVTGGISIAAGGGRVTEIMARPLLNALWPELAGVAQPLAGEYAARRSLLETLPFPCGYGVEIALLIDALAAVGLDAIAQVDLGERGHRHQDATRLSRMSAQVLHAALNRADVDGVVYELQEHLSLPSFRHEGGRFGLTENAVQTRERPPLLSVPEYAKRRLGPLGVADPPVSDVGEGGGHGEGDGYSAAERAALSDTAG
jgi:glucosyl-3-phosphoglycerate synthase